MKADLEEISNEGRYDNSGLFGNVGREWKGFDLGNESSKLTGKRWRRGPRTV